MSTLFNSVFSSATSTSSISVTGFVICMAASLIIGAFLAGIYSFRNKTSTSFLLTMGILPAIVCVVIMMVNGNIGTGVAVAGAFSLVRFRSVPGTAREIAAIFLGMGTGLICGMGYIGFAAAFAVVLGIIIFAFNLKMADDKATNRTLRITVPEDLDFAGQFDEILSRYTADHKLVTMKTTNMGSLYKLTYDITMMDPSQERAMVDELRTRNGNLEIAITERQDHTVVL